MRHYEAQLFDVFNVMSLVSPELKAGVSVVID